MNELKKGMEIDGIAATEAFDSQAERLNLEGMDISSLERGAGALNDNHSKGFINSLGRITGAKKIFKKEDCENDRQKMYWEKAKSPFLYIKGELYDDVGHPNAKATAAIIRGLHKAGAPLSVKMSVEGSVLARKDGGILDRTKVHSVALTFTPANKETLVQPMGELSKSDETCDWSVLMKSVAIQDAAPAFIERNPRGKIEDLAKAVLAAIQEVTEIKKALSAGYPGAGSSEGMTGGAVLQLPSIDKLYASCWECGKRQVVRKNQTGCAHCKKSWSMDTIAKFMLPDSDS